jgi:hypothetical protein
MYWAIFPYQCIKLASSVTDGFGPALILRHIRFGLEGGDATIRQVRLMRNQQQRRMLLFAMI